MLAQFRAEGLDFDEAWVASIRQVKWPYDTNHRRQWRTALNCAEPEFRACYEQRTTRINQNAAALASVLAGREGVDRNDYELVAAA